MDTDCIWVNTAAYRCSATINSGMNLDQGGGTGFIGEEKGAAIGKQDIIAKPNIGSDKPNHACPRLAVGGPYSHCAAGRTALPASGGSETQWTLFGMIAWHSTASTFC